MTLPRATAVLTLIMGTVGCGHALVRDSVQINVMGQARVLQLVSDDARITHSEPCGANPTGVTLGGHFRIEMTRVDGSPCGRLEVGRIGIEHGDGWDQRKVLILDDYNGDGRKWEVALLDGDAVSNGCCRILVGFDPATGSLRRCRFRHGSELRDTVWAIWALRGVRYERPYLRVTGYDNSGEYTGSLYCEERFRWNPGSFGFVLVKAVRLQGPPSEVPWPLM